MNILFTKSAWEEYLYWQSHNQKLQHRINELIKEIMRSPFSGIGKPEALRQNLSGFWSRRINSEHRLIYRLITDGQEKRIEIISCKYHY